MKNDLQYLAEKLHEAKENFMVELKNTDIPIQERYKFWCDNISESDRTACHISSLENTGLKLLIESRFFGYPYKYETVYLMENFFEVLDLFEENIVTDEHSLLHDCIAVKFNGDLEACKEYFMEESIKCGFTNFKNGW